MNAVVEREAPARAGHAPRRTMAATAVQPLESREQLEQCHGIQLLQTHSSLFGEFIEAHDVIEVDFDIHRINGDAEFLIGYHYAGDRSWYGVRRFEYRLNGELWVADPSPRGEGVTWGKLSVEVLHDIEVFGMVREVYKPYRKTRFHHG